MLCVAYFVVARACLYSALVSVLQTMPVRHRSAAVLLSLLVAACATAHDNPPNNFGGLTAFAPGRGGVFRVSTSERAWIELIDRSTGAPLAPISSDKRLRCFGVPKSLLFEIRPGHDYLLQITAAASPEVDLLIAQAAK